MSTASRPMPSRPDPSVPERRPRAGTGPARPLATTLLIASPWLALFIFLVVDGDTFPTWFLAALALAVLMAAAVLASIGRDLAQSPDWRRPDEVEV